MINKKLNLWFNTFLTVIIICTVYFANGQPALLNDKPAQKNFKKSLDYNYNSEFVESEKILEALRPAYQKHPAWLVAQALRIGALNYPFEKDSPAHQHYQALLDQVIEAGQQMIKKNVNTTEAEFFMMLAYSLQARDAGDFGHSLSAVNYARKAYPYMKRGFDLKTQYPEFYFTTGLYNYYRIIYPEIHPIYQPFCSFFPDGSKTLGLADMEQATYKSTFSAVEAHHFLSLIYSRFEQQTDKALVHAENLYIQFPKNLLFRAIYAECQIQKQQYAQVLEHAKILNASSNTLYHVAGWTFAGYAAIHENQDQKAKICFQNAIDIALKHGKSSRHWQGLAYAAMARLALKTKPSDTKKARYYYDLAYQNCQSSDVRNEAKLYLKQ